MRYGSEQVGNNAKDHLGLVSGRLTVIAFAGRVKDGHLGWLCQCECGKQKVVPSNSLSRPVPVQSCGCLNYVRAQEKRRPQGAWNEGKSYAIADGQHCYKTRHAWARAIIRHYGNKCERCGWDKARCDAHHREAKAGGGKHTIENGIVLCPNCHRLEYEGKR